MDIKEEQKTKELTLLIDITMAKPTLTFPARELRTYMESIFSIGAPPAMFHACEWVSYEMFEKILKKGRLGDYEKIRTIGDIFSNKGWGELEFLEVDKNNTEFRIKVEKCFECEGKNSSIKDCYMIRGLLTGALSALFSCKIITIEIKCRFKDNDFCEFLAFPSSKSETEYSPLFDKKLWKKER